MWGSPSFSVLPELIQNSLFVGTGKKPKTEKEERVKHIKVIFGCLESPCWDHVLMIHILSHPSE